MKSMIGGSQFGLALRATILSVDLEKRTCVIGLDEQRTLGSPQTHQAPLLSGWFGNNGGFLGGIPEKGTSCLVRQTQGGEWFIENYLPNNSSNFSANILQLTGGSIAIQPNFNFGCYLDPSEGIKLGSANDYLSIDFNRSISVTQVTNNFNFTASHRQIAGIITRDLAINPISALIESLLTSKSYQDQLTFIGLDPSLSISFGLLDDKVRNPPLTEYRNLFYEFPEDYKVINDLEEFNTYYQDNSLPKITSFPKRQSRAVAFSLSPEYSNHLLETIIGTGVDAAGNILDLNKNILPIGQLVDFSLIKNAHGSAEAYSKIKALSRKSLALHLELNTRKGVLDQLLTLPNLTASTDYLRDQSNFSFDVDKEGTVKANFPASSEIGNVPLLLRYQNYSTLLAAQDSGFSSHQLLKNENKQDIFHQNFGVGGVVLEGDNFLPVIDRITGDVVKLNTAFHDITKICSQFYQSRGTVINYDSNNNLNTASAYSNLVAPKLQLSGLDANAGGRSVSFNLDGFAHFSIGAETANRHSVWIDTAGSILQMLGRDKNNLSSITQADGDVILQIGGVGLAKEFDTRFTKEFSGSRTGKLEIRILKDDGQLSVLKFDDGNLEISVPGRMIFTAGQDIVFNSQANLLQQAENIIVYPKSPKPRYINRSGSSL